MRTTLFIAGACTGAGVLFVRLGLKGRSILVRQMSYGSPRARTLLSGLAAGGALYLLTTWPIVAVAGGLLTFLVAGAAGRRQSVRGNEDVAEAIALWTEQLRDTLAAAHGLQQTISATGQHAPLRIRAEVQRLVAKLPYAPVSQSLREFATEVNHPSADFVSAALIAANEYEARDVGSLLGHLASCSREEARMHQRIWVGRARTRSAVRIISFTVVGFVGALFVLNRDYLDPYGSTEGQLVLALILGVFAAALLMLQVGSTVRVPERFVGVES